MILRRIAKNASWSLSAQMIGAGLGIVSLSIAAHALGAAGLGVLAIVQAYSRIFDRIFRLEPWQAVIKHGIAALDKGDGARFERLIKTSLMIDLGGSLLSGGVTLLAALSLGALLGLSDGGAGFLATLGVGHLFGLRSTGMAVLRIFDRFDLLAKLDVTVATGRLALSVAAYASGVGIWGFVLIALLESLANGFVPILIAWRQLRLRGYGAALRQPMAGVIAENPGLLRLLWNSNLNVILRQTAQRLDIVILAFFVDPVQIGYFHVARRVSDVALKFSAPLNQAIYPELSRLWATGQSQQFLRLVRVISGIVAVPCLLALIPVATVMPDLLAFAMGPDFRAANQIVMVQMVAVFLYMSSAVLNAGLLSMGRDRELVRVTMVGSALFLMAIAPLVMMLGTVGASVAHVFFNATLAVGFLRQMREGMRDDVPVGSVA
jgi:O-antigen/teichoic acid export membrane protein